MKIQSMFQKDIDRDINGVIKVSQDDQQSLKQELSEYIITKELRRHFATFFDNYVKAIDNPTDKIGVWISGFFGSGKSHFLKILSYLLQNKQVGDKHAIDYFIEDQKITNQMVLADMQLAANTPSDVILFNIDSKSDSNGKENKDAIVNVFLKVLMRCRASAVPCRTLLTWSAGFPRKDVLKSLRKSLKKSMAIRGKALVRTSISFRIPLSMFFLTWIS